MYKAAATLCAMLLFTATAYADTAKVKSVTSGDTLNIEVDGETQPHRIYGVDAPEEGQPFALEAKQFVSTKTLNIEVQVETVTKDTEGVPVVKILLPDGAVLNELLLKGGLAWWDEPNTPNELEYLNLQAEALAEKAGLWSAGAPLAPWDYRKSNDIESVSYKVDSAPVAPVPNDEKMEEETKVLAAKGTAVYEGNFIDAGQFDPKAVEGIDPMDLLGKHQPRVATDANGNPIGLTASNISQLPYAAQLGLQDGDVISSVNGISLTGGLPQIMGLVQQHRNNPPKSINVDILRGGKTKTITVNLP